MLFPILEKLAKRDIFAKLKILKKFDKLSREQQLLIQREELYKILVHCRDHIPFYQKLFFEHEFDLELVKKDINYIKTLPLLTKEIVKNNLNDLKLSSAHHCRKTGGSTGQSVHFFYDNNGLDWTSAINLQAYDMAGNFLHKNDCHISSELGVGPTTRKGKFLDWLKLFSQNRNRIMISSFSDKDLEWSFNQLKKIKPYLLQGHPSSAFAIAEYIKKMGFKKKCYCKVFEPSGEMLTDKMVTSIEEHLGCKVVNRYGNAEFGVMAHSEVNSNYKKLKVFERAFFIEDSLESDLIVTGLTNSGMPLIRYVTGDIGTVKYENNSQYILNIQGRIHDSVNINGDNYATHFIMDYLDHKIKGVKEFQIVTSPNSLPTINIIPEVDEDFPRIEKEFKMRWPDGINVRNAKFDDFKTVGWRQKFRHVVSTEENL